MGLGGTWEGQIITQELYDAQARNTKFIPILFFKEDSRFIPAPLRTAKWYLLFADYDGLYRRLTKQPLISMPDVGSIRRMLPRDLAPALPSLNRKQDFQPTLELQQTPAARAVACDTVPQARVLDAAMPARIIKDRATELLVLIRLPESCGLKGVVQSEDDSDIRVTDVRSRLFDLCFTRD